MSKALLLCALTGLSSVQLCAQLAARFDMSLTADGSITEQVSHQTFKVESQLPAFTVTGISDEALRFDGYSNYVRASLPGTLSTSSLTVTVVLAAETYPMMKVDVAETTPTFGTICGNLDENAMKGFAWQVSSQGDLRFQYGSSNGFLMSVTGTKKLPRGQWCVLTAVLEKSDNTAKIYLNGEEIGSGRMNRSDIAHSTNPFYIGKDDANLKSGPFLINTFCGLIDEIRISNSSTLSDLPQVAGASAPDFSYPASRYAASLWRPQFHGMPSGGWTNETHGMFFSNGRYHVFFQKNANGPYMSRLHWGHISSENLYSWREEPIAIAPGESYDIKGCWSGCVYEDGGTPYILYTAVDNAKATIAQAKAADENLAVWEKHGVVVNGRPAGLSDDFRDPYFFTSNGQKYMIVGTSKNGIGACTLHKYQNGAWTNDGSIFFQGASSSQHGTFWEMPNVTPMGNGQWLFTCTPLNTGVGVRTLCWVGTIGNDGKFSPSAAGVQYLELGGVSRDGYGLLSPTIYQKDNKTLLLGIVPDKLPTQQNYEMGWAHTYALPREISLSDDGLLMQKPYSGLTAMRTATTVSRQLTLSGNESLAPVSGRQIELLGEFTVAGGTCGFNFLKSDNQQVSLAYHTDTGELRLDMTTLNRVVNDRPAFEGLYSAMLPQRVPIGGKLKLHVFLDGSIADIFVNDSWAFSIRLFPTDPQAVSAETFATSATDATLKAWTLDASQDAADHICSQAMTSNASEGRSFDLQGRCTNKANCKGIYIKNHRKYVAR